jgi:hypothetical protein
MLEAWDNPAMSGWQEILKFYCNAKFGSISAFVIGKRTPHLCGFREIILYG